MLTEETQDILCNLFFILAKGERNIRITRQVISNTFDFSPYHVFNYLANLKTQTITPNDIYDYLNLNDISISENESKLIVLFYDKNFDNALTYEEFYNFIQNDKNMNKSTNNFLYKKPSIGSNIEFLLLKLFKKEIDLAKKLIIYLKRLRVRQDFDIHKIFHYITDTNFINKFRIEKLFEKNYKDYIESDIKNIIRRLDINKDGVIDLREFYAFLEFPKSSYNYYRFVPCTICRERSCDKCLYINNSNNYIFINNDQEIVNEYNPLSNNSRKNYTLHSINYSSSKKGNNNNNILSKSQSLSNFHTYMDKNDNFDIKNNTNYKSQKYKKIYSNLFEENKINNYNSELIYNLRSKISFLQNKKKMEKNPYYQIYPQNYLSPNIKSYYINIIDSCFNSYSKIYDIDKFNILVKLIMEKEMEIEKEKISFIKSTDIGFEDIFNFFDKDKKGYISIKDLETEFESLEINNNNEEIKIFINRYDLLKHKSLNQLDFFDAIVPYKKEYRLNMENKSLYKKEQSEEDKNNIFNNKVNSFFLKKLLMFIINKEKEINEIKKRFYFLKEKLNGIFKLIDKEHKGYFTYSDLNNYLINNEIIFDSYPIALLFIRFDKKREGKIELYEMIDELKPFD